jgi:hypothetical protein
MSVLEAGVMRTAASLSTRRAGADDDLVAVWSENPIVQIALAGCRARVTHEATDPVNPRLTQRAGGMKTLGQEGKSTVGESDWGFG